MKSFSEKYGVGNREQAQSIIDVMIRNAAEQIVTSMVIAGENGIEAEAIQKRLGEAMYSNFGNIISDIFEGLLDDSRNMDKWGIDE